MTMIFFPFSIVMILRYYHFTIYNHFLYTCAIRVKCPIFCNITEKLIKIYKI